MSDSPEETEYYLRFISMYIDLCTGVVYRVFVHAIQNKDTVSFFQSNCKLFHDLEKRKVLSKAEIAFVISSSPRPEQFDVSLLIKILCNSKTALAPPLNGWDSKPGPSDLSIAADLLRLRKIRNTIIGHRPRAKLPKYKFDRLWEEVEGILLRLANATDPSSEEGLREKIEHYRNRPLQTQDKKTTFYLGKLQEWWQTCEEVSKLQNKVEDLVQKIQEISLYFKTKPQDYCLYIRLLFDGGRSVLSGILKKELSSRGLDLKTLLLERASQLETNFINEKMRKQVFPHPNNPNTDYDTWDMLTLTIVVLHIFGDNLNEEVVEEIKIIEVAVKSYAQRAIESLDMTKFKSCCEDLVSSLKTMSNYVGGETKTNFKMHFEAYRNTDDEIDVDNYLNQMALYASEIKSIPGIYNKTIADLKESANQMKEEGVVFEREKDMDLKMVVIGRNKEKETLAEEILETVWQSALKMSSSTEKFSSVRVEVDKILDEVRKIPSANITTVSRHCIILTIRYSSWEALLEILKYMESRTLREHFENISSELGYICGETVELSGIVTIESVHRAMIKLDKHKPREDSSLNVAISCSSVESMEKVFTMLNSDESRQIFSNIDHALSKCVRDRINVRASPDVKEFCHLFDIQEIPFIERSGQIAGSLQSTEEKDQEQMEKLFTNLRFIASVRDCQEQSGPISTSFKTELLRYHLEQSGSSEVVGLLLSEKNDLRLKGRFVMRRCFFCLFDCISIATLRLKILNHYEGRTFENPDYLRRQMLNFLRDYSEQFDSVLHVLKELSSVAMLFKDDIYSGVNYKDVLDAVNTPAIRSFKTLVLYAIATYLKIRIFVLSRNCLGHLQWFYFCPLFEFKTQQTFSSSSYISIYWSSNEFYIIREDTNVPPKAYGLLGMYLTALNDMPIDRIDVSRKLVNIPYDRKELLWSTMDEDIVEECWNEFRRHGLNIASAAPKRSQFVTFVKDSEDAFTIVCKVLVKNKGLKKLNSHLSDVDALVDESKYVECLRMVCEIDEAVVEINFEVSKFENECEKQTAERRKTYFGQTLDKVRSLKKIFTSVVNALNPLSDRSSFGQAALLSPVSSTAGLGPMLGLSFGQAAAAGAVAPMAAKGPMLENSVELNTTKQKENDELLIFLDTKLKEISEKQKKINDFFEWASLLTNLAVQSQPHDTFDRPVGYVKESLFPDAYVGAKHSSIFEKCSKKQMENEDVIKTMYCKQRVINSIFRGSFEDLERMITLRK